MGKQAFVNASNLQSFMKTNTCPRGKKKLDCISSLDIQYFKKKKSKKKINFCEFQNDIPSSFLLQIERNPTPVMNLPVIGKNLLTFPHFDDIETNFRPNRSNDLFSAFCF